MSDKETVGVLQRTLPYLTVWAIAVVLAGGVSPGFAGVVGCVAYAVNASLRASIGGEPLYVP